MKKVLILSNHFITLYNFRKELISKLIDEEYEVYLSLPKSEKNIYFAQLGCKIIETEVDRRGINPLKDFRLIIEYIKIMKRIKPNIILSYTIKPNIYGSIASNITKNKQINNITGTGNTFIRKDFVSFIAKKLYMISIKKSYLVYFQNNGDKDFFVRNGMIKDNFKILPGSGVNLSQFEFCRLPDGKEVNFIFIGRIMKLKGIDEYLNAAKLIKKEYPYTNFYIAGFIEEEYYRKKIELNKSSGIIKYIGFQKNIKKWIKKSHCTILPSHGGEGVPNVLLESASMGRACIASEISGSKSVIEDGITGYMFKPKSTEELYECIVKYLSLDGESRRLMGKASRKKIAEEFDRNIVIDMYIDAINKA